MMTKKMMLMFLATFCLATFAVPTLLYAKPVENRSQSVHVINVYDLTDQDVQQIMEGERPDIAVEFPAHISLPISFFLNGDLAKLAESDLGQIELQKRFYLRCVQKELLLSTNLSDWKTVLEFITGNISVAFNIEEGEPTVKIYVEINQRT